MRQEANEPRYFPTLQHSPDHNCWQYALQQRKSLAQTLQPLMPWLRKQGSFWVHGLDQLIAPLQNLKEDFENTHEILTHLQFLFLETTHLREIHALLCPNSTLRPFHQAQIKNECLIWLGKLLETLTNANEALYGYDLTLNLKQLDYLKTTFLTIQDKYETAKEQQIILHHCHAQVITDHHKLANALKKQEQEFSTIDFELVNHFPKATIDILPPNRLAGFIATEYHLQNPFKTVALAWTKTVESVKQKYPGMITIALRQLPLSLENIKTVSEKLLPFLKECNEAWQNGMKYKGSKFLNWYAYVQSNFFPAIRLPDKMAAMLVMREIIPIHYNWISYLLETLHNQQRGLIEVNDTFYHVQHAKKALEEAEKTIEQFNAHVVHFNNLVSCYEGLKNNFRSNNELIHNVTFLLCEIIEIINLGLDHKVLPPGAWQFQYRSLVCEQPHLSPPLIKIFDRCVFYYEQLGEIKKFFFQTLTILSGFKEKDILVLEEKIKQLQQKAISLTSALDGADLPTKRVKDLMQKLNDKITMLKRNLNSLKSAINDKNKRFQETLSRGSKLSSTISAEQIKDNLVIQKRITMNALTQDLCDKFKLHWDRPMANQEIDTYKRIVQGVEPRPMSPPFLYHRFFKPRQPLKDLKNAIVHMAHCFYSK